MNLPMEPSSIRSENLSGLRFVDPEFALALREMEVEEVRALGSHKLFICRPE
jgi:hypothetical protein